MFDMEPAEDHILKFVRLLSLNPNEITVRRTVGEKTIFEISIPSDEANEANTFLGVIQAIVAYTTGLLCDQFEVKLLGK